jgi:hypothetical protein
MAYKQGSFMPKNAPQASFFCEMNAPRAKLM